MLPISMTQEVGKGREEGSAATQKIGKGTFEDGMALIGAKPLPQPNDLALSLLGKPLSSIREGILVLYIIIARAILRWEAG